MRGKSKMEANTPVTIDIVSGLQKPGSVADYELFFARRALASIKERPGPEERLKLIQPLLDESTKLLDQWANASQCRWKLRRTVLRVTGVNADEFMNHFMTKVARNEALVLAIEPEHFVFKDLGEGKNADDRKSPHARDRYPPSGQRRHGCARAADLNPDYPIRFIGRTTTGTSTKISVAQAHQMRNTKDGCEILASIYFPADAPDEVIEGHCQHLAVEFGSWLMQATEAYGRPIHGVTHSAVPSK
jgi:hypothetical protein